MSVTEETFQLDMSRLKEVARSNIEDMSVTEETSHDQMLPLKEVARSNIEDMSVTEETFQLDMSPLKDVAPENMLSVSVTEETSQADRLPLKYVASWNMALMSVTRDRSGASVALYIMLEASSNEPYMELHVAFPHWTSATSFAALVEFPAKNRSKSPDMVTLYEPAEAYAWVALPDWVVGFVPSPQFTVYVPVWPPTCMVIASLEDVVFHVVTKSPAPKLATRAILAISAKPAPPRLRSTGTSRTASVGLPDASRAAPAPAARVMDVAFDSRIMSANPSVAAAAAPDAAAPSSDAACVPPVTLIREPFTVLMSSLNRIDMVPLPMWYVAPSMAGFVVSRTATAFFGDSSIWLSARSATAPC